MAQCITCGTTLHPERAQKYNYCLARECQEKNAKGLTMVAVGMNKAADELLILDERTREDLATGKYRDQRRGSFGTSALAPAPQAAPRATGPSGRSARRAQPQPLRRSPAPAARRPWTQRQEPREGLTAADAPSGMSAHGIALPVADAPGVTLTAIRTLTGDGPGAPRSTCR